MSDGVMGGIGFMGGVFFYHGRYPSTAVDGIIKTF